MEKRTFNTCLIRVSKGKSIENEREAIFEEIMTEDFPELKKGMNLQIYDV